MQKSPSVLLHAIFGAMVFVVLTGCRPETIPAASHPAGPSATVPASAASVPTSPAPVAATAIRVKAGSTSPFTDSSGNVWLPDQGFDGGDTIERPDVTVTNTTDPGLYKSEHYSMDSFSCKLANGKYLAKLHFAETYEGITAPGQRVFSFNVQGQEFKDFDVWAKAGGPYRAYVETVPVEVTNGQFKIVFVSSIENPQINGIEVIPQ